MLRLAVSVAVGEAALARGEAVWCLEFWLNRYQTFFGALAAIGAAYGAWRIGMRQIRSAEDGLVVARRQSAASVLDHLISRRKLIETAIDTARNCETAVRGVDYRRAHRALSDLRRAQADEHSAPRDAPLNVAAAINDLGLAGLSGISCAGRAVEHV